MYEVEPVLRLKKDGKVVLTAEEAERLASSKASGGESSDTGSLEDNSLSAKDELLAEYTIKSLAFKDVLANMYRNPVPTVDVITLLDGKLVLIKRGSMPYKGYYALPGGFIEYGESAEDAAVREVIEETGLHTEVLDLVGVYSDPERDPRRHTITTVFFNRVVGGYLNAGDDASEVACFSLNNLPPLAFDHEKIIKNWQNRVICRGSESQAPKSL